MTFDDDELEPSPYTRAKNRADVAETYEPNMAGLIFAVLALVDSVYELCDNVDRLGVVLTDALTRRDEKG